MKMKPKSDQFVKNWDFAVFSDITHDQLCRIKNVGIFAEKFKKIGSVWTELWPSKAERVIRGGTN